MRKKSSTIVEFRIPIWNTIVFWEKKTACLRKPFLQWSIQNSNL